MQTIANALTIGTVVPLKKRVRHCIACGYPKLDAKNERNYLLCSACNEVGVRLDRPIFDRAMRSAEYEAAQISYRGDPNLLSVGQVYALRLEAAMRASLEIALPNNSEAPESLRELEEEYDGPGAGEFLSMLDAQYTGAEISEEEFSAHAYLSDADAEDLERLANEWAREQGVDLSLLDAPEPEEVDLRNLRLEIELLQDDQIEDDLVED